MVWVREGCTKQYYSEPWKRDGKSAMIGIGSIFPEDECSKDQKVSKPADFAFVQFMKCKTPLKEVDRALSCMCLRWSTNAGSRSQLWNCLPNACTGLPSGSMLTNKNIWFRIYKVEEQRGEAVPEFVCYIRTSIAQEISIGKSRDVAYHILFYMTFHHYWSLCEDVSGHEGFGDAAP